MKVGSDNLQENINFTHAVESANGEHEEKHISVNENVVEFRTIDTLRRKQSAALRK